MGFSLSTPDVADMAELLAAAKAEPSDDSPAMNQIVSRFDRLAVKIAVSLTRCGHLQQDLANESRIACVRAVRAHDSARAGFPSYAERYMRGAALRELRRNSTPNAISMTNDVLAASVDRHATGDVTRCDTSWGGGKTAGVVAQLKPTYRRLLHCRYIEDAPLKLIAAEAGTSVSAVSQRLSTAHRLVARLMTVES